MDKIARKIRLKTLISIVIIVPVGFLSNMYDGAYSDWLNDSVGGSLYEIFWCLIFLFLFPKAKAMIIALIVFLATCSLECLQLWHPPFLEILRQNYIIRTIIGNSFQFGDFPYYLIGSLLGWFWMDRIKSGVDRLKKC